MEERKAQAMEARRKAEQEKQVKEEEQKRKQAEIGKEMKKRHQRFLSQQRKKLHDQNKRVASERAKQRKKKEQESNRQKARAKIARKYFEQKVKVFEDKRSEKLKKMKEDYQKFYEEEKVQSVISRYEGLLKVLFNDYAKLSLELNKDISKQMETVNLKKLLQLAYDFNITPTVCLAEECIQIYNHLLKEDNTSHSLNIDFKKFKDFLVRVAIIGRKMLQGEEGERKMKISKSTDLHPMKKRKAPREQEFWEPDLDTTGLSQKVVQSLFLYIGLDDSEDEAVLKRRLKALRNKLASHPPGPVRLPRVPLTRKEEREKQRKEKQMVMTQLQSSVEQNEETLTLND